MNFRSQFDTFQLVLLHHRAIEDIRQQLLRSPRHVRYDFEDLEDSNQ